MKKRLWIFALAAGLIVTLQGCSRVPHLIRKVEFITPTTSIEREPAPTRVLRARRVEQPPRIDGSLNDACWKEAEKADDFQRLGGGDVPPEQQTAAMVCFDDKNIYVAFRCKDADMAGLKAVKTGYDDRIWREDCIEVFFDTNLDRVSVRQIGINAIGTVSDLTSGGEWVEDAAAVEPGHMIWRPSWSYDWNARPKVATGKDSGSWTVEMAIPVERLGLQRIVAGTKFGMNFGRTQPRRRDEHYTCWSRTLKTFHEPHRFGHVILGEARCQVEDVSLGAVGQGRNQLALQVSNRTGDDRLIQVDVTVSQPNRPDQRRTTETRLQPSARTRVQLAYDLDAGKGTMTLRVAVRDAEDGEYYLDTQFERTLRAPIEARLAPPVCYTSDPPVQLNLLLHLGGITLEEARLQVRLEDESGVLRESVVSRIEAARVTLGLDISGLAAGYYQCVIESFEPDGKAIANVALPLALVDSPLH